MSAPEVEGALLTTVLGAAPRPRSEATRTAIPRWGIYLALVSDGIAEGAAGHLPTPSEDAEKARKGPRECLRRSGLRRGFYKTAVLQAFRDGETRTRTGDTTIFRES
jgi:hypothetical protein